MVRFKIPLTLIVLISLTLVIYLPGISGPFLYDDFANLAPLYSQTQESYSDFWYLITNGVSSELGRPISLVSFLIQPATFPDIALSYKFINLLIHIFNGLLLCRLSFFLYLKLQLNSDANDANTFAIIATGIWLLHPLFVSTNMYVIQRMTQLSCFFSLLALNYFITINLRNTDSLIEIIKSTTIASAFIIVGILSKENAAMIFPIILLLGYYITTDKEILFRKVLFIYCSSAIFLLAWKLYPYSFDIRHNSAGYSYGAFERLLTQVWILKDYIGQLIFPNITTMSLHHDDIKTIDSLTNPNFIQALLLQSIIVILIVISKNRLLIFSLFWFYVWHILESSFIPLILYFEHRNYLPGIGIIWTISWLIVRLKIHLNNNVYIRNLLVIIPIILLSYQTVLLTQIWSDKMSLLEHWSIGHPNSERTQLAIFNYFIERNDIAAAEHMISNISEDLKINSLAVNLTALGLNCALKKHDPMVDYNLLRLSKDKNSINRITQDVQSSVTKTLLSNSSNCRESIDTMVTITHNILNFAPQKKKKQFRSELFTNLGFLELESGNKKEAIVNFTSAYEHGNNQLLIALIDLNLQLKNLTKANYWLQKAMLYENTRPKNSLSLAYEINLLMQRFPK